MLTPRRRLLVRRREATPTLKDVDFVCRVNILMNMPWRHHRARRCRAGIEMQRWLFHLARAMSSDSRSFGDGNRYGEPEISQRLSLI